MYESKARLSVQPRGFVGREKNVVRRQPSCTPDQPISRQSREHVPRITSGLEPARVFKGAEGGDPPGSAPLKPAVALVGSLPTALGYTRYWRRSRSLRPSREEHWTHPLVLASQRSAANGKYSCAQGTPSAGSSAGQYTLNPASARRSASIGTVKEMHRELGGLDPVALQEERLHVRQLLAIPRLLFLSQAEITMKHERNPLRPRLPPTRVLRQLHPQGVAVIQRAAACWPRTAAPGR